MLKKILSLLICVAMILSFAACASKESPASPADGSATSYVKAPENPQIRLATTTSVNDSGLLNYLLPYFESETGYKVQVASAGTGVAIGYAKSGDADLLLVHSKAQEEDFITGGYASTDRISFMYNYFVICGPTSDPAHIADKTNAAEAFKAIAAAKSQFASRGDNSGTNNKETKIWESASIVPANEKWYVSVGSGMGDTLNKANELNAYVLTDKATFLSMKSSLTNLSILKAEADDMKNTYSLLGVKADAETFKDSEVKINTQGANALIEWLTSEKAAKLIENYGKENYGEQLFFITKK